MSSKRIPDKKLIESVIRNVTPFRVYVYTNLVISAVVTAILTILSLIVGIKSVWWFFLIEIVLVFACAFAVCCFISLFFWLLGKNKNRKGFRWIKFYSVYVSNLIIYIAVFTISIAFNYHKNIDFKSVVPILWAMITVYIAMLAFVYFIRQKQLLKDSHDISNPSRLSDTLFSQGKRERSRTDYFEHKLNLMLLYIAVILTCLTTGTVFMENAGTQVLGIINLFFITNALSSLMVYVWKTLSEQLETELPVSSIPKGPAVDDKTAGDLAEALAILIKLNDEKEKLEKAKTALTEAAE